jgi:hypothetical protein
MIGISFDKARAEYLLDSLANGKTIAPASAAGWSQFDMLQLAGACFFAALSQGPPAAQQTDEATFRGDMHAAIEFYAYLTSTVRDQHYDEAFEPHLEATLGCGDREGQPQVAPIRGFKIPSGVNR